MHVRRRTEAIPADLLGVAGDLQRAPATRGHEHAAEACRRNFSPLAIGRWTVRSSRTYPSVTDGLTPNAHDRAIICCSLRPSRQGSGAWNSR